MIFGNFSFDYNTSFFIVFEFEYEFFYGIFFGLNQYHQTKFH